MRLRMDWVSRGFRLRTKNGGVCSSARDGNPVAIAAIDRGALAVAVGITNVLNILDIHTVVIGGGVSSAGGIYWEPFLNEVVVYPAKLRGDAGLLEHRRMCTI